MKSDKRRNVLKERYARLVCNEKALEYINIAYRLRDDYLHSLGDPKKKVNWRDLAQARWAIAMAVDNYLHFANRRPDFNRSALLRLLES